MCGTCQAAHSTLLLSILHFIFFPAKYKWLHSPNSATQIEWIRLESHEKEYESKANDEDEEKISENVRVNKVNVNGELHIRGARHTYCHSSQLFSRWFMCSKRIFTSHPPSSKTRYKFTQQWTFMVAAYYVYVRFCTHVLHAQQSQQPQRQQRVSISSFFIFYFLFLSRFLSLAIRADTLQRIRIVFGGRWMRPHRFYFNFCFHRIIWWKSFFYRCRRVTAMSASTSLWCLMLCQCSNT